MTDAPELIDIPRGKIAAVVTYLEMLAPPDAEPRPADPPGDLVRVAGTETDRYRDLFTRIGEDWLWYMRREMSDADLRAELTRPGVELSMLVVEGRDEGLLELDFSRDGECKLAYFGVTPALVSSGAARWLMATAIRTAWSRNIGRFWLHTCTLDHPNALPFYLRCGFTAYGQKIEIADDPRLTGTLPRGAAPQFPIIEP